MKSAIEFHDSELGKIVDHGERIVVYLQPAYVHRSEGEPGVDDGIGGWQACTLTFENGTAEGTVGELPTDVMHGELIVGGEIQSSLLSVPDEILHESVSLALFLDPDYRKVTVSGENLRVLATGAFEYVEEFRA